MGPLLTLFSTRPKRASTGVFTVGWLCESLQTQLSAPVSEDAHELAVSSS